MKGEKKVNFIVTAGHLKSQGSRNSSLKIVSGKGPEDDGLISGRTRVLLFDVMLVPVQIPSDLLSDEWRGALTQDKVVRE
jgi:hypothetical protein